MYKILFAGAVISTLMLVQANSEAEKKAEVAPVHQNEALVKAYEDAKKNMAEHKDASTLVKNASKELPLIPEEKSIKEFPTPLAAEENDPTKIAAYYKTIAETYEKESRKAQEAMTRAHQAKLNAKQTHQLKSQRASDKEIASTHDITMHKTTDKYGKPFQSAKHTPPAVHGDSQAMQDKRYSQLKSDHDKLELKHKFYAEIAVAMEPKEIPASEVKKQS